MLSAEAVHNIQIAVLYQAVRDYEDPMQREDVRQFLRSSKCEYLYNPFFGSLSFAEILNKLGG